jgi:4-diphosphocytidyl-2-C-methyl-D-erythritol kinase
VEKLIVESPAKINLGLNIVRKRNDGYHDIETIFLPLLLSDQITFRKSEALKLDTNSQLLNNPEDNIILKAIRSLEKRTNKKILVEVFVEKVIPIGGGLGGGSSNAAITLKTINKLFDLGLDSTTLFQIALELGSDVPYFLNPIPAFAESRGEILFPLKWELPYPILIVNPGIKIDTSWAFGKIKPSIPKRSLKYLISSNTIEPGLLREFLRNDFEELVFVEFPQLKEIKETLYSLGAQFALMSGTGSTLYGIFSNLQKAYWAEDYFKKDFFSFLNNPFIKGSIT